MAEAGLLSAWIGVWVKGAKAGYDDLGLTSGSEGVGGRAAGADAMTVDI